jgi:GNAT superfamily N-acetyltransferase
VRINSFSNKQPDLSGVLSLTTEGAATARFVAEDRPFGRVAFIYDIAVEPEHRRKGYAQTALGEIESWARANDCVGVQLHVFGGNMGARALYQRAGYIETDVMMLKRTDG